MMASLISQVGGPDQTFKQPVGLRFSFCLVGDLCQVSSDLINSLPLGVLEFI